MSESLDSPSERQPHTFTCPQCQTQTIDAARVDGEVIRCSGCGINFINHPPPLPDAPYQYLRRIPRSVEELRDWLSEADAELTDLTLTWSDFVSFVYDDDAHWIAHRAFGYAVALLPVEITANWKAPERTEHTGIYEAIRYVRTYLAGCMAACGSGHIVEKSEGKKSNRYRGRGRPTLDPKTRQKMVRDYADWKVSGLTQREFVRARGFFGRNEEEALAYLGSCRKQWEKESGK